MAEEKKEQGNNDLLSVDDLQDRVELQGYRFAILALVFYFAIPIFYYNLYIGYTMLDSFYVRIYTKLRSPSNVFAHITALCVTSFLVVAIVLCGDLLHRWLW